MTNDHPGVEALMLPWRIQRRLSAQAVYLAAAPSLPLGGPSEPTFVHCWACRFLVTPSGRKSAMTVPPHGDPDDICRKWVWRGGM